MEVQQKEKTLDLAISQIEKQFGKGSIMRMGENSIIKIDSIPTGSISLDAAIGIGGAFLMIATVAIACGIFYRSAATEAFDKHINIRYHHFRSYVSNKIIQIMKIDTKDQPADILTKPVSLQILRKHRQFLMGW